MINNSLKSVRRLFFDLETSPNLVLSFQIGYNVNLNHESVVKERKIICVGYKFEGDRDVTVLKWTKDQDEVPMLRKFLEVFATADEAIFHYGNNFDLPYLRTRCLILGLGHLPPIKTVDTKTIASKKYLFNSNKLDYISSVLGHGKKLKTDFGLWRKIVLDNDQKSLAYMAKYCGVDVKRLESVYHDLRHAIKPETHAGVFAGKDKWTCPYTGSTNVVMNKRSVTSTGALRFQMHCDDSGAYYTISEPTYRSFLAAKKKSNG
jgi:predicted PolB exonuclease-like 3'-5' exonuclease